MPGRFLRRIVDVEPGEGRALVLAFVYFFLLLSSFAVLRPVRDAMAIASGVKNLPWLFTGTFVTMLVVVPIYGVLTRRVPRRRFIPIVYRAFAVMTVGFYFLLAARTGVIAAASAFYIWVGVYNIFVVSVFWSFMADVFRADQARRLFGFIAAGGTLGSIAGPFVTIWLADAMGAAPLLLVTAVLLELAVQCALALDRSGSGGRGPRSQEADAPVSGGVLQGFLLVVRSRYLAAIALHVFLYSLTSTFLYVEQQHLVAAAGKGSAQHTVIFAQIDLITQLATLAIQVLLTGRILRHLGVAVALATLPVITAIGSGVLVAATTLPVLILFQAIRRASQYALERPGRESIFTTTGRDVRYRSKNFMDTVVFRGGDSLTAWMSSGLAALGLGFSSIAAALVPLSLAWAALATWIGRKARKAAVERHTA